MARSGVVLVTAASYPAKDFQGLIAQLKTRKGKSSFASYSPGTVSQYAGLILNDRVGLDMQHVGYPGSPPALQDLLGGIWLADSLTQRSYDAASAIPTLFVSR